jgi:hypothetical protein
MCHQQSKTKTLFLSLFVRDNLQNSFVADVCNLIDRHFVFLKISAVSVLVSYSPSAFEDAIFYMNLELQQTIDMRSGFQEQTHVVLVNT